MFRGAGYAAGAVPGPLDLPRTRTEHGMLRLQDLSKAVVETEYAVRGPIVARARTLEAAGREITYCNIGNPQSLGQQPLSYVRQVLALCECPELMGAPGAARLFPQDAIATARRVLEGSQHGLGAYSESRGMRFVCEAVADFIRARDGVEASADAVYLTDGASKGVQTVLRLVVAGPDDGVMIPIPQYPLYSATLTLYGARQVGYHLDEAHDWQLGRPLLERSLAQARAQGVRTRAICVINPGNPTGSVLDPGNVAMVLDFAREHDLVVLADEVYQDNVYAAGRRFTSFAKVLHERGMRDVSLFSFHSVSKGYLGECGHRGGYFEHRNVPPDVVAQLTKLQSVNLCANTPGQVVTYLLVRPPREGEPSHARYVRERDGILSALRERAQLVAEGLNRVPGIRCNEVAGAMYAFPSIELPPGRTDEEYCMALLEAKGICVVAGSGFGQQPGTAHFRTTILPPTEKIARVVEAIADFHRTWR